MREFDSPATASPRLSGKFYRPELDLLRFLAFFLVYLHHTLSRSSDKYAYLMPHWAANICAALANAFGYGLCLFFFLSAYLIAELLMREQAQTGTIHVSTFYKRRILRIWPLYFFGIALGIAIAIGTRTYADLLRFSAYLVMLGNWWGVYFGWSANPMNPLWSISIEEQFYLVWPILARYGGSRTMYGICAALISFSFLTLYRLGQAHAPLDDVVWGHTLTQGLMFATGILVALILRGQIPKFSSTIRIPLLCLFATCWFCSTYIFDSKSADLAKSGMTLIAGYSLIAIGCSCLFLSILGIQKKPPAFLIYLGRISYGLYVFHLLVVTAVLHLLGFVSSMLVARLIAMICSLPIIIGIAALSFRYLEMPFLHRKERLEFVSTRPATSESNG